VIDSLCSKLADRLAQKELVSIPPDGAGAMDQRKSIEQFKDSDYTTVLTLTFEDKERAEALAATFNAAYASGRLLARATVAEVASIEQTPPA
jgi:hypothetical protein